jgi:hypothetical protein
VFFNIARVTKFDRGKRSRRECCGRKARTVIDCVLAGMWKLRTIRKKKTDKRRCLWCLGKKMTTSYAKTGECRKQFTNKGGIEIMKYNYNNIIIINTIIIYIKNLNCTNKNFVYISAIFLWRYGPSRVYAYSFYRCLDHTHTHTRQDSSGQVKISSNCMLPTRHTTNTRDEHPYPKQDSNPRSQQ